MLLASRYPAGQARRWLIGLAWRRQCRLAQGCRRTRNQRGGGVRAKSRVTCARTVEATCVLYALRSTVGVLTGVEGLQADNRSKTSPTPIIAIVFSVCDI